MPTFTTEQLEQMVADALQACGVPHEAAGVVADHLVEAEVSGVTSHGFIRIVQYTDQILNGTIVPAAELTLVSQSPSVAVFDGHHGLGQVMCLDVMQRTIAMAASSGVAAATLVNTGHTGRLGHYSMEAARHGMMGYVSVNAGGRGQWVAPFGGTGARLGTNPISFAVPTDADHPIVLDFATSVVPEGKVRAAQYAGKSVPEGWLIDHKAQHTTNPEDLYGPPQGALLPFGGHKGFGLALMVEALSGALSGAGTCHDLSVTDDVQTDGVFMLAINIEAFCPRNFFTSQIRQLIEHVKTSPPSPGFDQIMVPGEPEARRKQKNIRDGVVIDDQTWQTVKHTLDRLDVSVK